MSALLEAAGTKKMLRVVRTWAEGSQRPQVRPTAIAMSKYAWRDGREREAEHSCTMKRGGWGQWW